MTETTDWVKVPDELGLDAVNSHNAIYGRWHPETKKVQKAINEGNWENFGQADTIEEACSKIEGWAKNH